MSMSNRARRMLQHQLRNKADAELNLIPMIDILSVMVSFLLVYSTEVEVVQNTKSIDIPQSISEQRPRQTVVVMVTKEDVFVQGERVASVAEVRASSELIIAPLRELPNTPRGYDLDGLTQYLKFVKSRYPDKTEASILLEPQTPYDTLVQVMDRTRIVEVNAGLSTVQAELFPEVSIGDAPVPVAAPAPGGKP